MKKVISLLTLAVVITVMTGKTSAVEDYWYFGDLFAGQSLKVGNVMVGNDADNLYIKYKTWGDWRLVETHLHVATSLESIPQNKQGNPRVGSFDYKSFHAPPGVPEVPYVLPLEWPFGTYLYIAAHCVVEKENADGTIENETAWGLCNNGAYLFEKNWSSYMIFKVKAFPIP